MKVKKTFLIIMILLTCVSLSSYNEGGGALANSDGSGARGGGGCSCHNPVSDLGINISIQLFLDGEPVKEYIPNKNYIIKITASNNTSFLLPGFGFRLSVVQSENAGTPKAKNVGEFGSLPDNALKIALGNYYVVGHKSRIKASSGNGSLGTTYEETITWTAPDTGTGEIQIFGVILAVDTDKTVNGDKWNKAVAVFPEHEYPVQINGTSNICINGSTVLHATKKGGTWYSTNPDNAKIEPLNESDAMVTFLAEGYQFIHYSINDEDAALRVKTDVPPVLDPISSKEGKDFVCSGDSLLLTENLTGGIWGVDDTDIAVIKESGMVGGISQGKPNITYTLNNACGMAVRTKELKILKSPDPGKIKTPKSDLCVDETIKLENSRSGGTWESGNSFARMAQDGTVTGVYPGMVTISYTVVNEQNCSSRAEQPLKIHDKIDPGIIIGNSWIKVGQSVKYTDNIPGGRWIIGNQDNSIANIAPDGMVTGISEGKTTITYNIPNDFCPVYKTREIEVMSK